MVIVLGPSNSVKSVLNEILTFNIERRKIILLSVPLEICSIRDFMSKK